MEGQTEIDRFLRFYEEHGDGKILIEGGVAVTPGCNTCDNQLGGCCAESFDMDAFVGELRDLAGYPPM